MIDKIVADISSRLPSMQPLDFSNLVGISDHTERISPLLNIDSINAHMIGIWGMGGIGKTTIAKYLYEQHKRNFSPRHCFMENVAKLTGEHGLIYLQEHFLCNILRQNNMKLESVEQGRQQVEFRLRHLKVFLVLDDVDDVSQVDALAKKLDWFGRGSKIIITTRDRGLLKACRVDDVHEVKCLDDYHSLQMFKQIAFEGRYPHVREELSVRASQLAQGLPSAIETFGVYMRGKTTMAEWESSLNRLESNLPRNIMTVLKLSYNGLEEPDKNFFLHIASLFNGSTVRRVTTLLDDDSEDTMLGLGNLVDKSLISVSNDGCIFMHALVEQMGREIVRLDGPWNQRILRDSRAINRVLSRGMGTEQIQCMTLHMCEVPIDLTIRTDLLEQMPNLKYLKFYNHLDDSIPRRISQETIIIPDELRLLHWDACPLGDLRFHIVAEVLQCPVEINLRYSNLRFLKTTRHRPLGKKKKEAYDPTKFDFAKLRRLDLTGSRHLRGLLDLSTARNLEELIIRGCIQLRGISESICRLESLRKLHVDRLTGTTMITDLQEGSLFRSSQIKLIFPHANASLNHLTDLYIEGDICIDLLGLNGNADVLSFTSNLQSHDQLMRMGQISEFQGFKSLNIERHKYRTADDSFECASFSQFICLEELSLINLKMTEIPVNIGELQSLETLNLSGNNFESLPIAMGQQAKLKYLILCNCYKLKSLPKLAQVKRLTLLDCVNFHTLLEEVPGDENDLSSYNLLELCLENCKKFEPFLYDLRCLTNLTYLDLSTLDIETLTSSFTDLCSLVTLCLKNCKKLISIEELPLSLNYLFAHGCRDLVNVPLSSNHSIKHLDFGHCFDLRWKEEVMTWFLNNQLIRMVTPRFACLPATGIPGFCSEQSAGTSHPLVRLSPRFRGFHAFIMIASKSNLQFPTLSYNWNWNTNGEFHLILKPETYSPCEEYLRPMRHLVIIHFPSSINNEVVSGLQLKTSLGLLTDQNVEITACGIHLIC